MAVSRIGVVAVLGVVAVSGAAAYVLTSGENAAIQLSSAKSVIRVEAAGVNYAGWPEMAVAVNGENVASFTIDSAQRQMYETTVPMDAGDIETIQIRFTNYTEPQSYVSDGAPVRTIVFRGLYLNDEKLEGGEPSGERNTLFSLRNSEGGLTWNIGG